MAQSLQELFPPKNSRYHDRKFVLPKGSIHSDDQFVTHQKLMVQINKYVSPLLNLKCVIALLILMIKVMGIATVMVKLTTPKNFHLMMKSFQSMYKNSNAQDSRGSTLRTGTLGRAAMKVKSRKCVPPVRF